MERQLTGAGRGCRAHQVRLPASALSPNRPMHGLPSHALLARARKYSGLLATETVASMDDRLAFFGDLDAAGRTQVRDLVRATVTNFIEWMERPADDIRFGPESVRDCEELTRSLTVRQTGEVIRVATEYFERWLPALARNDTQLTAIAEAVLRYSRELALETAAIYATAGDTGPVR